MSEINKNIRFNAFQILVVFIIIYLMVNGKINYIINFINYIINIETPGFWFIMVHIFATYMILISLKIELGFRAAINLKF